MKKRILRWALVAILLLLTAQAIWDNQNLGRTDYHVTDGLLPEAFDGYRIVQISDLHNASFGKDNSRLIEMVRSAQPDIITITGDMIDSRRTNVDVALQFAREAVKIAPCYYVTGNHELRDEELDTLLDGLETAGVTVLRGESVRLEKDGQRIQLVGIDDPSLVTQDLECYEAVVSQMLDRYQSRNFTILLTHRPEFMGVFCRYDINLALAGHNHGGQVRLPWLGGLFASGELFPKYDGGLYQQEGTSLVVSRGLGNSLFPLRINNPPEVVMVTLHTGKEQFCEATE